MASLRRLAAVFECVSNKGIYVHGSVKEEHYSSDEEQSSCAGLVLVLLAPSPVICAHIPPEQKTTPISGDFVSIHLSTLSSLLHRWILDFATPRACVAWSRGHGGAAYFGCLTSTSTCWANCLSRVLDVERCCEIYCG
jgi:hypothetical protein